MELDNLYLVMHVQMRQMNWWADICGIFMAHHYGHKLDCLHCNLHLNHHVPKVGVTVLLPWQHKGHITMVTIGWAVQLMTHCWENDIILQPVNMCGWGCYVWVAQGSTHKVGERTYSAFSSLFLLCPPPMTAWRSLESAHQRSVPTTRSNLLHWPMEEGNKSEVAMTRTEIATEAGVAWLVKENTSVTTCTTPPLLLQGYTKPITIACSL